MKYYIISYLLFFQTLITNANIIADFAYSRNCINDTTQLINTSQSDQNLINFEWTIYESVISSYHTENINHKFVQAGQYYVKLKITDISNNIDSVIKLVIVNQAPHANFTLSIDSNNINCVYLDGSVSTSDEQNIINTFIWTDSSQIFSNIINPHFCFDINQSSYICLKVTDNIGCIDDTCAFANNVNSLKENISNNLQIKIYPIPTKNSISILNVLSPCKIKIIDDLSRQRLGLKIEKNTDINLNFLEVGMYILVIENETNKVYKKIIKIN